ncbi:unnamed protein product [Acanthoscelides obtectus]|nr:unnamed protein product [Acanthoscelides obtectus]CAK1663734.1 hypothetical protein AOBTE_LOCUS23830 [Acanthoscelides obtectus]
MPTFQDIPEYEPSFPELTESLDSPLLPLKTTVLSSVDVLTSTVTESRLRTYTFVVTRVSGTEQIISSTTEVRPQVKTTVLTEPVTKYTTLTLLDFDDTADIPSSTLDLPPSLLLDQENTDSEEARYNLATRVMSNGVEVIVAGDKTTYPGDDAKRILPSAQVPITLKPSTLTDRMVLTLPQETASPSESTPLLYNDQFITKTCLTTFTYLTTYLVDGKTSVSSHEQVVSNIATEERNTGKILPTPAVGITLTQYPNLSVGLFKTTYTYLNTILDGEQPLVVSSKHTVTNTVTAPDDYLSFLKPSETTAPLKDTNTYYSTINLEKTLYEGNKSSVISTRELVTQVIITESIPPRATSVMTSYIALDDAVSSPYSTTDVVKTYYVTYTYYNTLTENGKEVIHKNISTSADVVTEKIYLQSKKQTSSVINTEPIASDEKKKQKIDTTSENFKILATKSYFTTFTYFTTLLQDNQASPTVVSSRSKVVENIVTETIEPSLVKEDYLTDIKNSIRDGSESVIRLIELQNGQTLEVIAVSDTITPTKVMYIEKTQIPDITHQIENASLEPSSSSNVITGSTIVFVDDDPFAQFAATPSLSTKSNVASTVVTNLGSLLSSEIVKKTKVTSSKAKRNKNKTKPPSISPTKIINAIENTESDKLKQQLDKKDKKQPNPDQSEPVSDLLGLGSININSLQALTPVLNAMAGLITTNLKPNRRSDNVTSASASTTTRKPLVTPHIEKDDTQNRSPIYIPVGGLSDDFEIAESQNIATFEWVDPPGRGGLPRKPTQEASLLNGAIPISPGDVITANSDVIVGKPGRVLPRIPSIPLNQLGQDKDIPLDMEPPPIPNKPWPKKNYLQDSAPVGSVKTNVIHVPNKDDYVGPPPPLYPKHKMKHIPLIPPKKDVGSYYEKNFNQRPQVYANAQTNYEPNHVINEINHEHNYFNLQESIHKNYHSVQSYPIYAQGHATPLLVPDFIKPSVPIVLPEVIERSTGQPLLVDIQPSQVAFVKIPFNRTTALIYGGSTEPHRNGQYFDDPSPYPDSGFSDLGYNRNIPQVHSEAYEHHSADQKQVNGVIKVGNQLINVEPEVSENQKVLVNIKPSKPQFDMIRPSMKNNHDVNVNVPPISFGLVQQGNEFHAHVINHNSGIEFRPPPQQYEVMNSQINHSNYPQMDSHPLQPLSNEILSQPTPEGQRPHLRPPVAKPEEGNFINKPLKTDEGSFNKPSYPQREERRPPVRAEGQRPLRPLVARPEEGNFINRPLRTEEGSFSKPSYPQPEEQRPTVRPKEQKPPLRPPPVKPGEGNFVNKPKYPFPPKRNIFRLKAQPQIPDNVEIKDYMTPPPYIHSTLAKRPSGPGRRPQPIPLGARPLYPEPQKPNYYHTVTPGTQEDKIMVDGPGYQIDNKKPTEHQYIPSFFEDDMDIGDHEEDDLPNEDGEVIQESNSRPLFPGEIPFEILKAKATTTERPRNNTVRFPSNNKDRFHGRPGQNNKVNVIDTDFDALRTSTERGRPGGFIVVGNQFESNDGANQIVVSGSQFDDKVPYNNKAFTTTERTTTEEYHRFSETSYGNVFSFKTKTTPITTKSPTTTTRKPVLIFLDDTGKQSNNFFNKNHERPSVTSLPIDTHVATTHTNQTKNVETQTEKPFNPQQNPTLSSNQILIKDVTTTTTASTNPELNTGEVTVSFNNVSKEISDMEILKPPPLVTDLPAKPPITKPSRLPENNFAPTKPPRNPLEELVPPPATTTEEVLGMSPPPLVTTYRPALKPIFPVQTNISKERPPTSSTTERYRHTRPSRRPFTRRPTGFRTSTTPVPITTRRRPYYPGYDVLKRNVTTTRPVISPSPTVQYKPSLQVIIGNPSSESKNESVAATTRPFVELDGSEASTKEQTTETTTLLKEPTDLLTSSSGSILPSTTMKEDTITKGVHHAGNEIKVIDDTPSLSTKVIPPSSALPTRYITYTKTDTVTITKTTVVRTSGLPPSTLTILVTKTEKSTIVDTVTEVRTLVKPTSVVETITTTVHQGSSLYPPDMYGSTYPSVQVTPSTVKPISEVSATRVETRHKEDSVEDFIITSPEDDKKEDLGQDSILVVMTDKNTKNIVKVPNETVEIQSSEEVEYNSVENNLLLGGIFIGNRPHSVDKCEPECKATRNELCQKIEGVMRCVCRPGFARMFLDRPCLPTYTYDLQLTLDRMGKEPLYFTPDMATPNSTEFMRYARPIREALDRMVMQSDLRDIFHGVEVHALAPSNHSRGVVSKFYLQLSDNMEEKRLEDVFRKYLENNSYSLGGTDVFASIPIDLTSQDFDECVHPSFHDCSSNAKCFNLKGTYTCSCKEGFADMSENMLYPGRVCSAEVVGCERCTYHGTCYSRGEGETICECFQWYAGDNCHVNLKVLLIALATLGVLLFILFFVCILMSCVKRKPSKMAVASGLSFLPQRVSNSSNRGTIDRRAMIQDTSSEDSRSETNTLPYVQNKKKPKGALKKTSKAPEPTKEAENIESTISFADQKDRSLTVMIPRAKYHPAHATSPILNYTSFDARKPSVPSITSESKLISYLDAGPSPGKSDQARKASTAPTETIMEEKPGSRKTSGALVSAGFEVSATVVNNMGTLGTTCGTEADRSENATLIQKISAELLSSADTRSQFNTLRQSIV